MFSSLHAAAHSKSRALGAFTFTTILFVLASAFAWMVGSRNPYTPAGYVGYLTKGAVFGRSRFFGVQKGPTSAGRTWLLEVTNVSVTPYTYTEEFIADHAVLSRDNLKISFAVHTVWRVDEERIPLFMERFSTTVTNGNTEKSPDAIVRVAYSHFVREPLRTYARDEVQRRKGLSVKDELIPIGQSVLARIRAYADGRSSSTASSLETSSTRRKLPTPSRGSSRRLRNSNARTPRSRSNGKNGRSARYRPRASRMRCRSSAAS